MTILHKAMNVPDDVCDKCSQLWEGECKAFQLWHSIPEWKHRRDSKMACKPDPVYEIDPKIAEFIANNNPVFCLFEGVCTTCGQSVEIKSIGGTKSWLAEHTWDVPNVEPTVWREPYGQMDCGGAVGGIEFICKNHHTHYIEQNRHGDWN